MKKTLLAAAIVVITAGAGCAPDEDPTATSAVSIQFKGMVGDRPFACGQSYPWVGGQTLQPADFRLYVQDLMLLKADGTEAPVSLAPDGKWQSPEVALIDFEDQSGDCTGTAEVNTRIQGQIAGEAQTFSGLRFTVGVPFSQNHQDQATAPSPLNLTGMFWSWQSGYKFVRIEGNLSSGQSYLFHLGSTGCTKDDSGAVTSCQSPNRAIVTLDGFDPARDGVVVDLAKLLAGSDLTVDAECHSQNDKASCGPYFKALGLPFMGQTATQSAFSVD